jgi:hypothetical protein
MKLRLIPMVTLGGALLVAGCMDSSSPTDLSPAFDILDAEHGDEGSHFYFLPPMVPDPPVAGVFDAAQPAVVEICEWTGSECALAITEFSVGAGTIIISTEDEHYLANWHAADFALDLTKLYRISVLVGAQELGYADVQPVANGSGLKNIETGEIIGLVDNRTLPIKLRIEEGALGITIDATALTAPTFSIGGIGSFPSNTPVLLALDAGTYTVGESSSAETHVFEITAAGDVSYAATKEPFFDGLGTPQLTLVGFSVDIDATAMTAGSFFIGGIGGFPSATVHTFTFLPGTKSVQESSGGVHEFEVEITATGVISYAATKEPFLDGLGTSQLTLVGYSLIIDATALGSSDFSLGGLGPFSTAGVQTIIVLPGIKTFSHTDVGAFDFEVEEDGSLDYDTILDAILSGRGTNTLTVTP